MCLFWRAADALTALRVAGVIIVGGGGVIVAVAEDIIAAGGVAVAVAVSDVATFFNLRAICLRLVQW